MLKRIAAIMLLASIVFANGIIDLDDYEGLRADFIYNPISGNAPLYVKFDASASTGEDIVYAWIFGDGYTGSGEVIYHTYDMEGNYNITLVVDNGVETASKTLLVSVQPGTAETELEPVCEVYPDKYGYVKIQALAGYNQNGFYCYQTNVSATIGEITYDLKKQTNCVFSKYVQLPKGYHAAVFNAVYPIFGEKSKTCLIKIEKSVEPELIIYSPKENAIYGTNDLMYIETVGMIGEQNVYSGDVFAELISVELPSSLVMNSMHMSMKFPGIFSDWMRVNVSDGPYILRLTLTKDHFADVKEVNIIVNNSAEEVEPPTGVRINVLYPLQNQNFEFNASVPIEAEFLDVNGLIISNADVRAEIYLEDEMVDEVRLLDKTYAYKGKYTFSEAGNYEIKINALRGDFSDTKTVLVSIGEPSQIAEAANFTITILSPLSDTYGKNSQINIRARVLEAFDPVADASVILYLNGIEYDMTYDRYGEYVYTTEALSVGNYEARTIASYENYLAEDSITFFISEHLLTIRVYSPATDEEFEIDEGDSIALTVDVVDETSDVVTGVLVLAGITEPNGRTAEIQLFQDPESGLYKSLFYATEEGTHYMTVSVSKAGYVGEEVSVNFIVKTKGGTWFPLDMNIQTFLTIIIALAIIILIIQILKVAL